MLSLLPLLVLWACTSSDKGKGFSKASDEAFDRFKDHFIDALWKTYPSWANSVGYHKYDSILVVPDNASRDRERAFAKTYLDSLHGIKATELSANNLMDYYLVENQLYYTRWALDTFKSYEWNPNSYNVGDDFGLLLSERYAPLDARMRSFGKKLSVVPAYYEAAKKNIVRPTREHTLIAISQCKGLVEIFSTQLRDTLNKSGLEVDEKAAILKNAEAAKNAVNGYVSWLQEHIDKNGNDSTQWRSFRIGKELYEKKFAYDLQAGYTAEEVYGMANKRKNEVHIEMAKRAIALWPKYFPNRTKPADTLKMIRMMLDTIASTHATQAGYQASVEKQLPELVEFIKKKGFIFLDPKKPLVVRRTPDYLAGASVASINAPGPYDKNANTYYNVDDVTKMDPAKAESYLREYNKYTLQIINMHEAIPGHYTQLVYANQAPSLIKSIFQDGCMVEGWAVYTERMMLEEGYGDNNPELWLMYYKWHLRSVCNTLLDYGLQVKGLSEADAMHLLRDEAFQEETEARGKYGRASRSQVQLCSYFTGFTEIYNLREEMKIKMGNKFNLKNFHEKFLSYGSAPVKYIRKMMLAE